MKMPIITIRYSQSGLAKWIPTFNKYKYDLVLLFFLFIIGVKYINGVSTYTDIALYDESLYLYNGINLFKNTFPDINLGPLYSIYYYILSIFQHDAIKLYYLNYAVLTAMMPILSYIYFRMFDIYKLPAFFLSIILLVSHSNYLMTPKVTLFALYLIFFATVFIKHSNKIEYQLVFTCVSFFIISFVRPEFMVSLISMLLIFTMISLRYVFKYKKYAHLKMCLVLFTLSIIAYLTMDGLPMLNKGATQRSFLAFAQHYAVNSVNFNKSKIKLNPMTDHEIIVRQSFGEAKTVKQAFINNPKEFFNHIKRNIIVFPFCFYFMIGCQHNLILPGHFSYWLNISIIIMILICYTIKLSKLSYQNFVLFMTNFKKNSILLLLFMFIATIPSIISALLIAPDFRYLLPLLVLILTIIGIIISCITIEPTKLIPYFFCILFIFIVPCLSHYQPKQYLETKYIIQTIQNLQLSTPIQILDIDGGYSMYQTPNYHWVLPLIKDTDFDKFLLNEKINMIVVSDCLINNSKFKTDKKWLEFLSNYNSYGFSRIDIPNSDKFILIQNLLMVHF
jgi:hypothetical protein